MIKKITMAIVAMLAVLFIAGAASAATVDVTTTGPVDPITGAYMLQVGEDAFTAHSLQAEYAGWILPATYDIEIRVGNEDPSGTVVWSFPSTAMPYSTFTQPIHWTPSDTGLYTVYANGVKAGKVRTAVQLTNPVPEIATVGLVGLGLVGLVVLRRKK